MQIPRYFSWLALGASAALMLAGCGKRNSSTDSPSGKDAAKPVIYGPAPGLTLDHLLINPTDSKNYVGFRVHYTLTEAEYEPVTPRQAWQETAAKSWVNRETFFDSRNHYVRLVRPAGSTGWQVGYFLEEYYQQIAPEMLFNSTAGVIHLQNDGHSPSRVVGKFTGNFPDGGVRIGRRMSELKLDEQFATGAEAIDISSPDFEKNLRQIAAAKQAELDLAKLPWMIQRLKPEKRTEGLARLNELEAKTKELMVGKREWKGVAVFPTKTVPLVLVMSPPREMTANDPSSVMLSGELKWEGRPGPFPASFNGSIESQEDSEFWLSGYNVQPGRYTAEIGEATRHRMGILPLSNVDKDLNQMIVRIIDRDQIEIRAAGIPPTVLTRSDAVVVRAPLPVKPTEATAAALVVEKPISVASAPAPSAETADQATALEAFRLRVHPLRASGSKGSLWQGTVSYPGSQIQVQLKITFQPFLDANRFLESPVFCDFKLLQTKPRSKYLSGKVDTRSDAPFPNDSFLLNTGNTNDTLKAETIKRMETSPLEKLDHDLRNLVIRIVDDNNLEIQADGVPSTKLSRAN